MKRVFFTALIFLSLSGLFANEYLTRDRHVHLIINNRTGNFSLFYLADSGRMRYEPLFNSHAPNASFIDVNVNGNSYRPGNSRHFSVKLEWRENNPMVIYESSFLTVTKVFSPVRTSSSDNANGVKVTITARNTSGSNADIGLRMLIDTNLGEKRRKIPFTTDNFNITKEQIIYGNSGERYWISQDQHISLMGNIIDPLNENSRTPDFLHFANWKRLSDASWDLPYREGRSFNYLFHYIRDSAVSYYWEPATLGNGETFTYTVYLTTADPSWYDTENLDAPKYEHHEDYSYFEETYVEPEIKEISVEHINIDIDAIIESAIELAEETDMDADVLTLIKLQEILNQFLNGEISLNEHDLLEIERTMNLYSIRH